MIFPERLLVASIAVSLSTMWASARTVSFSPRDANVRYSPSDAWQRGAGNASMKTREQGSEVVIKFAGEQIVFYGSASSPDALGSVTVDDRPVDASLARTRSASPARLLEISNLSPDVEHVVRVRIESNDTTPFVLSRIAVAYSSSTSEKVPELVPWSDPSPSATTSVPSSALSSSSLGSTEVEQGREGRPSSISPGSAIGITIGALFLFASTALLFVYLYRRHQRRSLRADHAKRGLSCPSQSFPVLPPARCPRTPLSPSAIFRTAGHDYDDAPPTSFGKAVTHDGVSGPQAPQRAHHGAIVVGSESWQTKLARAASWRRKAQRLHQTREFYQINNSSHGGRPPPSIATIGPPPALPLPTPPGGAGGGGTREMEERWRTRSPELVLTNVPPFAAVAGDKGPPERPGDDDEIGRRDRDDLLSIQVASPTSTMSRSDRIMPSSPTRLGSNASLYGNPFSHARTLSGTTTTDTTTTGRGDSIEHARISHAQTRSIGGTGTGEGLVVAERHAMVERKPSLTRIVNGRVVEDGTGRHPRGRHESVAGVIQNVVERTRPKKRRSDSQDGPDFFLRRQELPKYERDRGDPRRL